MNPEEPKITCVLVTVTMVTTDGRAVDRSRRVNLITEGAPGVAVSYADDLARETAWDVIYRLRGEDTRHG